LQTTAGLESLKESLSNFVAMHHLSSFALQSQFEKLVS